MDAGATTAAANAAASGADADDSPTSQLRAAIKPVPEQKKPLPVPAAPADPAPAMATTSTNIAESGVEDEQLERFYALLANIRAMRGMYVRGSHNAGASTEDITSEACCGLRKRARCAEPPWRPTFRMEDFEEAPGGSESREDRRDDQGVATSWRPGKETKDVATQEEGDDYR